MQTLDRRHFFSAGALALAGSSLPFATPTTTAAPAKAAGRIKLGLATYSYWHFTREKYPIEKVIDHAADLGSRLLDDVLHRTRAVDDDHDVEPGRAQAADVPTEGLSPAVDPADP